MFLLIPLTWPPGELWLSSPFLKHLEQSMGPQSCPPQPNTETSSGLSNALLAEASGQAPEEECGVARLGLCGLLVMGRGWRQTGKQKKMAGNLPGDSSCLGLMTSCPCAWSYCVVQYLRFPRLKGSLLPGTPFIHAATEPAVSYSQQKQQHDTVISEGEGSLVVFPR